jgi:hypothetical protein
LLLPIFKDFKGAFGAVFFWGGRAACFFVAKQVGNVHLAFGFSTKNTDSFGFFLRDSLLDYVDGDST